MMDNDLLKGLTFNKHEGSNIVIARKEIVIPKKGDLISSIMSGYSAKQINCLTYMNKGGIA